MNIRNRSMKIGRMIPTLLILVSTLTFGSRLTAGTITGTVDVQNAGNNGDVIVFIDAKEGLESQPTSDQPVMNQENLKFVPHVLPVSVGTTVQFKNSDAVAHNIFTPSPAGDMFNLGSWKGDQVKTHTFDKTGEVVLLCNLHPEMEGYIYVTPNAYFAKTDNDGNYSINNIPAGNYTLRIWSENGNARPQNVTVPESGSISANFTVR